MRLTPASNLKEHNLEGRNDKDRWQTIQRRLEFATEQRDLHNAHEIAARDGLVVATISNARELPDRMKSLTGLWAPAAIAMRGELESTDAAQVIASEMEKNFEAMRSALNNSMDALEDQHNRMMQERQSSVSIQN